MSTNNTTTQNEQEGGEDSHSPVPKTFYLYGETKRDLGKWLNTLEIEHDAVYDSDKAHQYEAIVQVAMNHEDEVVKKIGELSTE